MDTEDVQPPMDESAEPEKAENGILKPPSRIYPHGVDMIEKVDPPDRCWCGVKNPYYAPLPNHCDGSGEIPCYCGGDLCVCHNHGGVECQGCDECREGDDDWTCP